MEKYDEFMKYKKWNKAVQKICIDTEKFNGDSIICDEAVHTLEIIHKHFGDYKAICINGIYCAEKIFETLSTKIKFIKKLIINGFSSYDYEHTYYSRSNIRKFFENVYIKKLSIKNDPYCNTEILRIHSSIPNISFIHPKGKCLKLLRVQPNEYINQINIEGIEIYSKLIIPNGSDDEIIEILRQADNNRIAYNALMTSIRYVYLAQHSGLFALLPTNLIDYIISKIYR